MADPLAAFQSLVNPDKDAIQKIAKLLLDDELSIVWGLLLSGNAKDLESIASTILKFFDQHDRVVYLMQQAITKEVELTACSTTLFRQNNFASKLLSTYSKRYGLTYIKYVLSDTIINICLAHQDNPDWSCEVDPSKLNDDKVHLIPQNQQHLKSICLEVLTRITGSIEQFPPAFKEMCVHLKNEADRKFPNEYPRTTYAGVGGFVFLRFICPAIVVPHKYGLLEVAPGREISRDLTLLSKVLQTVANGATFGKKEEYLTPMNDFLEEHQTQILDFLNLLAEDQTEKPIARAQSSSAIQDQVQMRDSQRGKGGLDSLRASKSFQSFETLLADNKKLEDDNNNPDSPKRPQQRKGRAGTNTSMTTPPVVPPRTHKPVDPSSSSSSSSFSSSAANQHSLIAKLALSPRCDPPISTNGTGSDSPGPQKKKRVSITNKSPRKKHDFFTVSSPSHANINAESLPVPSSPLRESADSASIASSNNNNNNNHNNHSVEPNEHSPATSSTPIATTTMVSADNGNGHSPSKPDFDSHNFSYGELMGLLQYLGLYWKPMRTHLVHMDNNLGTKHTEDYIQMSVLLEKLGVRAVDASATSGAQPAKVTKKEQKKIQKLEKKKAKDSKKKEPSTKKGIFAGSPSFDLFGRHKTPKS